VLSALHLTRRFGDRVAVDDVSFDLAAGEVFALLGPNGAGKTTILRMIAGLIAPTSGSVRLGRETMSQANAARLRGRIGFLTEAPGLWDSLSVRMNLVTYARLYGVALPDAAVDRALDLFEIRDRAGEPTARLSKGLKQRVALARCLIHQPPVVLLDEPTSGLDPGSARDVRSLIQRLRGEGRAIVLCTHNLDEVERLADRVAVLKSRLVAVGTPEALGRKLFAPRVRITLSGPADAHATMLRRSGLPGAVASGQMLSVPLDGSAWTTPDVVRMLAQAGASIESVVPERPRLEDVYLGLLDSGGGASERGTSRGGASERDTSRGGA
jgi:ABC-2 type transport system ATP-binding protein